MIISHKHKFIFIHIPKNAGSSISDALMNSLGHNPCLSMEVKPPTSEIMFFREDKMCGNSNLLLQHSKFLRVSSFLKSQGLKIDNFFTFSFVRNPWSRAVSHYFYGLKMFKDLKRGWPSDFGLLDFKEYLCLDILRPQYDYVLDPQMRQLCNFIGKVENYQDDFNTVCGKIGIPQRQLPHVNKSDHKHYTEYYDNKTREIVAEKYARDIEHFRYEFGE